MGVIRDILHIRKTMKEIESMDVDDRIYSFPSPEPKPPIKREGSQFAAPYGPGLMEFFIGYEVGKHG